MKYSLVGIITAATLAALPIFPRFGFLYGATGPKAFLITGLVVILGMFAAGLLAGKKRISFPLYSPLLLALVCFLLVQTIASFLGVYPEHSLLGDLTRSTGVIFLAYAGALSIFTAFLLSVDDWSLVRRAVLISSGFVALLIWVGVDGLGFGGNVLGVDFAERGLTFGNETYAAMYLLLGGLFGSIELARGERRLWKNLSIISIIVIATSPIIFNASALLSFDGNLEDLGSLIGTSRASSVTLLGTLAFLGVWWGSSKILRKGGQKIFKSVLAAAAAAVILTASVAHLIPGGPIQSLLSDRTTQARFIAWEAVLPAVAERPLSGWGPDNFDFVFEKQFNSSLYLKEGKTEVWFDKAHNPVIETLVTSGAIGVLAGVLVVLTYLYVVVKAYKAKRINETEAVLLGIIPIAHFVQLQTAFNTVTSYALLAVISGYVLSLDKQVLLGWSLEIRKRIAVLVLLVCGVVFTYSFVFDLPRQASLTPSLNEGNNEVRRDLINLSLSRTSDFEALRRSSTLFTESVFEKIKVDNSGSEVKAAAREYLAQYLAAYERYLVEQPSHYRARMHYAYLLLLDTEWGGNRAQDAADIIRESYKLSPENPLTYVLDIMARAYLDDYEGAGRVMQLLKAKLPSIRLTQDTEIWLTKQIEIAPRHSFLIIGNL